MSKNTKEWRDNLKVGDMVAIYSGRDSKYVLPIKRITKTLLVIGACAARCEYRFNKDTGWECGRSKGFYKSGILHDQSKKNHEEIILKNKIKGLRFSIIDMFESRKIFEKVSCDDLVKIYNILKNYKGE